MTKLWYAYLDAFKSLEREIWYLALMTFINRAGTMVIPFLALYLTDSRSFTMGQVGWVMSAFGVGSLIGSWLGGKLADKVGHYPVMVYSLLFTGIAFVLLQFVHTFIPFCLGILVLMIIADTFRPASFAAINDYSKKEDRTRSVTLIRLAINLGFSFGPAAGGLIISTIGYGGLFWIDGITCIGGMLVIIALLKPKANRAIQNEKSESNEAIVASSPLKDAFYRKFLMVPFLIGFVFMQLFSVVPLYFRDVNGLSEKEIGWLIALNGFIIFLFEMPLIKYMENRFSDKLRVIAFSSLLFVFGYAAMAIHPWLIMSIIFMALITVGEMLAFPFTNSLVMDRAPKKNAGIYLSYYTMTFSAAHIIAIGRVVWISIYLGINGIYFFAHCRTELLFESKG